MHLKWKFDIDVAIKNEKNEIAFDRNYDADTIIKIINGWGDKHAVRKFTVFSIFNIFNAAFEHDAYVPVFRYFNMNIISIYSDTISTLY